MSRVISLIFLICFLQMGYSFDTVNPVSKKDHATLIKNTIEQLDYLVAYNKDKAKGLKKDDRWFIYIAGGTLDSMTYYKNLTAKGTVRTEYLKYLNDSLISLNSHSSTSVYVAFTDYKNEILTPVFPDDATSLLEKEAYIKKLINNVDNINVNNINGTNDELEKSLKQLTTFSKDFQKIIEEVYEGSEIKNINKPNILRPFSNYSIRQLIKSGISDYKKKKIHSYTLYTPKLKERIVKGQFKKIYNEMAISSYGSSPSEQVIDRVIRTISIYYHGKRPPYKECEELLKEYQNKPIMTEFPDFRRLVENDPCILKNVVAWGEDIEKSEWMEMTEMLIAIPLYAALAVPAASIVGSEMLVQFGREKARDAAIAAGMNIGIQTIGNYYFGTDDIIKEKDREKRRKKALFALDRTEFTTDVIESLISTSQATALNCLKEGVKIENINWADPDISKAVIKIDLKGCVRGAAEYLFVDQLKDQALGYLFKKLKSLARRDPKLFIKAWRELIHDLGPGFKETLKKGGAQYHERILDATGISSLSKGITEYIYSSFDVDEAIGDAVKQYAKQAGGQSFDVFENNILEVATHTDIKIKAPSSKIKRQGANITLEVKIDGIGKPEKIVSTLLEEIQEDGKKVYRIVFINKNKSLDNIQSTLTDSRQNVVNAIKDGKINNVFARGGNAEKHLDIQNDPIDIVDVEVRIVDVNGKVVSKRIANNRTNNAGSKWLDDLESLLGAGSKTKIQGWLDEGLDVTKVEHAFGKTSDKANLFNKLDNAKGVHHRKVLTDDYNVSGITQGNYLTNSVDNINNDVIRNVVNKEIKMYKNQASTFINNASLSVRNSIEIVEDLGNGIQLIKVKPGTKMYRVFDGYKPWDDITRTGSTLPNGSYWTFDKPTQISDVIEGTAVMPEWNGMSKIIEIEVPSDGLYGWYGKAAKQPASNTTTSFYLKGGEEQVIISFGQNQQSIPSITKSITSAPWID